MPYYMLSVNVQLESGTKNLPFINPYETKERAFQAVGWQKSGGFNDDYRVTQRISKTEFKCVTTNEIFTIDKNYRTPYTVEAWQGFIDRDINL